MCWDDADPFGPPNPLAHIFSAYGGKFRFRRSRLLAGSLLSIATQGGEVTSQEDRGIDLLSRVLDNKIGPLEAADQLAASGAFSLGVDTSLDMMTPEQVNRCHALLGRLTWHVIRATGAIEVPEPRTIEECIAFLQAVHESAPDDHAPGTA